MTPATHRSWHCPECRRERRLDHTNACAGGPVCSACLCRRLRHVVMIPGPPPLAAVRPVGPARGEECP